MRDLGADDLPRLSAHDRPGTGDAPRSPSWVQVYRELVEWAILYSILRNKDFGTDTLIVCDGLLRSKVFAGDLFKRYLEAAAAAIERQYRENRRRIYLVGVAKHSKVLSRYRLAMAHRGSHDDGLSRVRRGAPGDRREGLRLVGVRARRRPRARERRDQQVRRRQDVPRQVRQGIARPGLADRHLLAPSRRAQAILGYLLADAIDGFPVPLYPRCLQKAHENAALVDFDFDILQDEIFAGIRDVLGDKRPVLDAFRLQDADPAQGRYG